MRVLFIVDRIPYPVLGGAALRNYNLLRRLAAEHEVWLVAFTKNAEQREAVHHLDDFCAGVEFVEAESQGALSDLPNFAKYILRGIPPELRFFASPTLTQKIQALLARFQFDVIHIDQIYMGLYLETIPPAQRPRTLWGLHDVDFVKYRRIIQLESKKTRKLRLWLNNHFMYGWEPRQASKFGRCLTVSEMDRQLLLEKNPKLRIEVIPNGVDAHLFAIRPEVQGQYVLIFVGNMAYLPCADAVLYFCEQILPQIRRAIPNVEFWVVGKDPPEKIQALNGDGIRVTGRVEDVRPYYVQSTACVVPLRAGGGTRLKILESLAMGRPVVSTSIGCEGLELKDGEHILIADDPAAFAQQTVRLLKDSSFRQQLARNGRQAVEARYDWDVITKKLVDVYREVAA
ncbi:MAG: glycosyltransferase [Anaerolineaceae bacterium]|nr:MAG: glycosyltransferase [Anaerolineaceae bacterium]